MSRKEKEVFVRMSEVDLRAVRYIGEMLGMDISKELEKNEEKGEEA